jgi:hypothetical protein
VLIVLPGGVLGLAYPSVEVAQDPAGGRQAASSDAAVSRLKDMPLPMAKVWLDGRGYPCVSMPGKPWTGAQIKALGPGFKNPADWDLYLMTDGAGDDTLIRDNHEVMMAEGLRFYTWPKDVNGG